MALVELPGMIDMHVHLREPGTNTSENFESGTKAAAKGGFEAVLDMPNNIPTPTSSDAALSQKIRLATGRVYTDLGFFVGVNRKANPHLWISDVQQSSVGVKIYFNQTTGPEDQAIQEMEFNRIFGGIPGDMLVVTHAQDIKGVDDEKNSINAALRLAKQFGIELHIAHISTKKQLEIIREAKNKGQLVTCEVTPHHLFLTKEDEKLLGPFAKMLPPLETREDVEALWGGLNDGTIDVVATDHAPWSIEAKNSENPPSGIPGLETSLVLMYSAVRDGRITLDTLVKTMSTNPRLITGVGAPQSTVKIDPDLTTTFQDEDVISGTGWTTFHGWTVPGRIVEFSLRGQVIYDGEKIVGEPKGRIIYPNRRYFQ